MDQPKSAFVPPAHLAEEWDNPAMEEFKRQEAEDRVEFAKSHTQEEWMAALEKSPLRNTPIRLVTQRAREYAFKPIRLPW